MISICLICSQATTDSLAKRVTGSGLLVELAPYVPFFQTALWVVLIAVGLIFFSRQLRQLFEAIRRRVETGSSLEAGPIKLGEDLKALEYVAANAKSSNNASIARPRDSKADDWSEERETIYKTNQGFFITHFLTPSSKRDQKYDIFVYLLRHKSTDFSDVSYAEFFFGSYWGNRVFKEKPTDGLIGVSTSAYGPFLCTCRVTMKNGQIIRLHRYIDFEMGRLYGGAP
jgi:hypothetical protein